MYRVLHYYGRFQDARDHFGGLPSWARAIVMILALPGIALIALSLVALAVSILALLLLTLPAYRLLKWVSGVGWARSSPAADMVEATIVKTIR